jgi:hypothetical protein
MKQLTEPFAKFHGDYKIHRDCKKFNKIVNIEFCREILAINAQCIEEWKAKMLNSGEMRNAAERQREDGSMTSKTVPPPPPFLYFQDLAGN